MPPEKSKAVRMQEASMKASQERQIRFMVTDEKGLEYHLVQPESVVKHLLDPDTPDAYIEVPVPPNLQQSVKHRFLHTSRIGIFDVHDELSIEEPTNNNDDTGKQQAVKGG